MGCDQKYGPCHLKCQGLRDTRGQKGDHSFHNPEILLCLLDTLYVH